MAEVSRIDIELADKAKSDFISFISHELRSPLLGSDQFPKSQHHERVTLTICVVPWDR